MTFFPDYILTEKTIPQKLKDEDGPTMTVFSFSTTVRSFNEGKWFRIKVTNHLQTEYPSVEKDTFLKESIEYAYKTSLLGILPHDINTDHRGDICPIQITEKARMALKEQMKYKPLNNFI